MPNEKQSDVRVEGDSIDLAVALGRLRGDKQLLKTLIGFFFEDAPGRMALLDQACKSQSGPEIVRQAHSLRGMAAPFEPLQFVQLARQIEATGSQSDLANLDDVMDRFHFEFERLSRDLKRLLD